MRFLKWAFYAISFNPEIDKKKKEKKNERKGHKVKDRRKSMKIDWKENIYR